MTLRQARPWIHFFGFLVGFYLLARTTLEFPLLFSAYQAFGLVLVLLFSIARLFQWWKFQCVSIDGDEHFTDRLLRHQLTLEKRIQRWFYDEP